ncbi:winged helix-turn-helix transcriptional regulator [Flexibacterium corallicola]|uniref:winged helix-turn-helix transcriptional regulator n=1 Tax=Flexibacterium corallicola TaxID=3037259 RepID=UPI00286F6EF6|nr:helix-turn-helix domain-containing protein [Pseudovibrio sp. M1P-2-3]
MKSTRSSCPINFGLELFGDTWSLLIIRDLIFNGKQTYGEFLTSAEGISTNILGNRLQKLEGAGILQKRVADDNKKVFLYSLTEKGTRLAPVLVEMIIWGAENGVADPESAKNLSEWGRSLREHCDPVDLEGMQKTK